MKLFVKEFVFLGHLSTPDGLMPTDHLVKAVKDMPIPDVNGEDPKKQLRSFLNALCSAKMPDCKSGETSRLGERLGNLSGWHALRSLSLPQMVANPARQDCHGILNIL
jgi:hypothetical protein